MIRLPEEFRRTWVDRNKSDVVSCTLLKHRVVRDWRQKTVGDTGNRILDEFTMLLESTRSRRNGRDAKLSGSFRPGSDLHKLCFSNDVHLQASYLPS